MDIFDRGNSNYFPVMYQQMNFNVIKKNETIMKNIIYRQIKSVYLLDFLFADQIKI